MADTTGGRQREREMETLEKGVLRFNMFLVSLLESHAASLSFLYIFSFSSLFLLSLPACVSVSLSLSHSLTRVSLCVYLSVINL